MSSPTVLSPDQPQAVVDHLTYANFRHNVLRNPQMDVERWRKIFPNFDQLLTKLKTEIALN